MRRTGRDGMTLVEVLVATTILGIGIVTLLGAVTTASSTVSKSRDVTVAASLARAKMEDVLSEDELSEGSEDGAFDEPYDRYAWSVEIESVDAPTLDDEALDDLVTVTTRVSWSSGKGEGAYVLTTQKLKEMPRPVAPIVGATAGDTPGATPAVQPGTANRPKGNDANGTGDDFFGTDATSPDPSSGSGSGTGGADPDSFFGGGP